MKLGKGNVYIGVCMSTGGLSLVPGPRGVCPGYVHPLTTDI